MVIVVIMKSDDRISEQEIPPLAWY